MSAHQKNNTTPRVLLLGWDAADWRVLRPLLDAGAMPNLKRMIENGVHGNLATLRPVLSPMLWTSIATGKRAHKHGIHGFIEPTPDGSSVRPITNLSRRCKAIWNILSQSDRRSLVVGWWPSYPVEPINGVMVSNRFQSAGSLEHVDRDNLGLVKAPKDGWNADDWPMPEGTVHPQNMERKLQEFRFHPLELTAEQCAAFIPEIDTIDPREDQRVTAFMKILAETISVHGAGTALMELEPWDFAAVYFDGIDHFGHGFMRYHPPKLPWVSEREFELYKGVVEGAYRLHDQMLGTYLRLAGDDTVVMLVSDHGFHPDEGRLEHTPPEPAGPAAEHRPFGVFVASGPGIRKGESVYGINLLDIVPTILTLFDLPVGEDMEGRPITEAFEDKAELDRISSWETVEGPAGMHAPNTALDADTSAEMLRHLVDLGYVEPPSGDEQTRLDECTRELRFNLAEAQIDAMMHADAAEILKSLWDEWPDEHRFGVRLMSCYESLGWADERSKALDLFALRVQETRERAKARLKQLQPECAKYGIEIPDPDQPVVSRNEQARSPVSDEYEPPPNALVRELRRIIDRLSPRATHIQWLTLKQCIMEGDTNRAKDLLKQISATGKIPLSMAGQFAQASAHLGDHEQALRLYQSIVRNDPDSPDALLGIAEACIALDNYSDALDAALSAVELEPANPGGHHLIGRAFMELGKYTEAEQVLLTAIKQAPGYAAAHRSIARLYRHHLDRPADAKRHRDIARIDRMNQSWSAMLNLDRQSDLQSKHAVGSVPRSLGQGSASHHDPATLITVVSGVPRSGTSMMMQMLRAGRLPICADDVREPDIDNPAGYLEDERVKRLRIDQSWLSGARGHGIKVIANLLPHLPTSETKCVIFMRRDIDEIVQSQRAMLDRLGRTGARLENDQLTESLLQMIDDARQWLVAQPDVAVLEVDYNIALQDPAAIVDQIQGFLPFSLNGDDMVGAVKPDLRRSRRAVSPKPDESE